MSIFRSTFPPFVSRQLQVRQSLLNSGSNTASGARTLNVQKYTGSRSVWARMVSFVDYKGSQDLAKKYVLESGTLRFTQDSKASMRFGVIKRQSAYGDLGDRQYGYRPMPGIISLSTSNKGELGSLRVSTVTFKANDKGQLDDLELLYMRPGYYVLLEWGWTMYMDTYNTGDEDLTISPNSGDNNLNSTDISKYVNRPIKEFISPTVDPFSPGKDYDTINEEIKTLQRRYSGNYDGLIGVIQNYTFELQQDGSYLCSVTLVSPGDVLDSIKMNKPAYDRPTRTPESTDNTAFTTQFGDLLDNLVARTTDDFLSYAKIDASKYRLIEGMILEKCTINLESSANSAKNANSKPPAYTYIPLSYLTAIVNEKFSLFLDETKFYTSIELPVYGTSNNHIGNGLCLASEDTISIDPEICIINNPKAVFSTGKDAGFSFTYLNITDITPFGGTAQVSQRSVAKQYLLDGEPVGSSLGIIGNIYVSVQWLKSTFNELAQKNKGEVSIYKFYKAILPEISYALGGVNNFDIYTEDNKAVIIDKNYTERASESAEANKFIFNIIGTDSVARSFKIASRIFESQSAQIAIAAGNRENLTSIATATQKKWNEGITDRLKKRVLTAENKNAGVDNTDQIKAEKATIAKSVIDLWKYIETFLDKKQLPATVDSKPAAQTILNTILLQLNGDTNYRAVMPLSFELTIDGISGVSVGQVFRINKDSLPKEYSNSRIGLIVTGVKHEVQKEWLTTITAKIVLLSQSNISGTLSYKEYQDLKKSVANEIQSIILQRKQKAVEDINTYRKLMSFIKLYADGNVLVDVDLSEPNISTTEQNRGIVIEKFNRLFTKLPSQVLFPKSKTQVQETYDVTPQDVRQYSHELAASLGQNNFKVLLDPVKISDSAVGSSEAIPNDSTRRLRRSLVVPAVKVSSFNKVNFIKQSVQTLADYKSLPQELKNKIEGYLNSIVSGDAQVRGSVASAIASGERAATIGLGLRINETLIESILPSTVLRTLPSLIPIFSELTGDVTSYVDDPTSKITIKFQ